MNAASPEPMDTMVSIVSSHDTDTPVIAVPIEMAPFNSWSIMRPLQVALEA